MPESIAVDASSSSFWDRVSNWVSENKAIAYTIAGTAVVVTGAGVVYYVSESNKNKSTPTPRKSKKERRKEKKEAEDAQKSTGITLKDEEAGRCCTRHTVYGNSDMFTAKSAPATVEDAPEELPEINETTVESFSEQVRSSIPSFPRLLIPSR